MQKHLLQSEDYILTLFYLSVIVQPFPSSNNLFLYFVAKYFRATSLSILCDDKDDDDLVCTDALVCMDDLVCTEDLLEVACSFVLSGDVPG